MIHGIGTSALALALLLAGCKEPPKTADRQSGTAAKVPGTAQLSAEAAPVPPTESVSAAAPIGKYVVELPAADATLRRISLDLRPDSTCVFKTETVGKGERVESGTWGRDGALVRIVIGPPREPSKQTRFAFAASRDSLVSAEWDTTRFGSEGLGALVRR